VLAVGGGAQVRVDELPDPCLGHGLNGTLQECPVGTRDLRQIRDLPIRAATRAAVEDVLVAVIR
jgi:hypothetical protein